MNKILYTFLKLLSKMPLSISYKLNPFLHFLIFRIFRYRYETVFENIKNSFPDYSDEKVKKIASKFYTNFIDYFIETIHILSMSMDEMKERTVYEGIEQMNEKFKDGKNVAVLVGHIFNYEWVIASISEILAKNFYIIYKKIRDPFWDEKSKEIRSRFGSVAVPSKDVVELSKSVPNDGQHLFGLVSDQSPSSIKRNIFIDFLNQKTLVFKGFESICEKSNLVPFYLQTTKIKQGKYHFKVIEMKPKGEKFEKDEITKTFFKMLEEQIVENPDNWLWSHKRWKHKPSASK